MAYAHHSDDSHELLASLHRKPRKDVDAEVDDELIDSAKSSTCKGSTRRDLECRVSKLLKMAKSPCATGPRTWHRRLRVDMDEAPLLHDELHAGDDVHDPVRIIFGTEDFAYGPVEMWPRAIDDQRILAGGEITRRRRPLALVLVKMLAFHDPLAA